MPSPPSSKKEYKFATDYNGVKGYSGVYIMKAAIEKFGRLDHKAVAQAQHGLKISAAKEPGVIMDMSFDDTGDLDRERFLVEALTGKPEIKESLPAQGAK